MYNVNNAPIKCAKHIPQFTELGSMSLGVIKNCSLIVWKRTVDMGF